MAASADDRPTRRDVLKAGAAAVAVTGLGVRSEARADAASVTATQNSPVSPSSPNAQPAHDFVVVGSGAGGGTVAARLVESGFRVLLLEAGLDPLAAASGNARPEDYQVPAFHPFATENPSMRWDFWVRHYANDAQQRRDPKYFETWDDARVDGVWYPRAAALGGCTAHNAMIFVAPHDADWNEIADL
ncbi:MAG TPA: NAD(P)-binding protein, partial [Vicinamibacterales bacterium]|nr:NAD(P)-binding protein [Vicinamibacterales bacterium]